MSIYSKRDFEDSWRDPMLIHLLDSYRVTDTIKALAEFAEVAERCMLEDQADHEQELARRARQLRAAGWLPEPQTNDDN